MVKWSFIIFSCCSRFEFKKFEQKQIVNIPKMQFILYEMYSNLELSDHMTIPLIHIEKTIENFTDLYSFQIALRKVFL